MRRRASFKNDVKGKLHIRHLLVALFVIPALYLNFVIYQAGGAWVALAILIVIGLGAFIYLSESAYTFRYLFPGLLGFGLFVIFPIAYMVFLSFTKYSSQNLLTFERSLQLLLQETIPVSTAAYKYKLYAQEDGRYILYVENDKDTTKRFESEPFDLKPGEQTKAKSEPVKLSSLPPGKEVIGKPLEMGQITREKLFMPMRSIQFTLPDDTLIAMEGLTKFGSRERLWTLSADGSLTNKKDGTVVRPDLKEGFFVNEKGEKVGVGFRTFSGLDNYIQIFTDPRIQGPFLRIFVWTVTFSALSVILTFGAGMLLAVILQREDLGFRRVYRTLLILPYAVPAILSILILKGTFNQDFGAANQILRGLFGFAPEWETNPWAARTMVLLVNLWLGYPYMMLICMGMLQSIPAAIYEASAIDGSNRLLDFFHITLPLVLTPMVPILISSFAFNFNNFNLIYLLTGGGPRMVGGGIAGETDLLVNYTFNIAFRDTGTNYGLASAIATVLFFIVGFLSWINLRLTARKVKI
jgi:maltose/maltodextrin transport system permease protein